MNLCMYTWYTHACECRVVQEWVFIVLFDFYIGSTRDKKYIILYMYMSRTHVYKFFFSNIYYMSRRGTYFYIIIIELLFMVYYFYKKKFDIFDFIYLFEYSFN